jgi:hypothetical protein
LVEAAAAAAAVAAAAGGGGDGGVKRDSTSKAASLAPTPVLHHSRSSSRSEQQQQQQSPSWAPSSSSSPDRFTDPYSAAVVGARTSRSSRASADYNGLQGSAAASSTVATAGAGSGGLTPQRSLGGPVEDDELSMLQAEVAFLGSMASFRAPPEQP